MAKAERIPPLGRFERSPLTQELVDRIARLAPEEIVGYDELSVIALGDVQQEAYHLLRSARLIALKDGIATDAVTNVGIKRLAPLGVVDAVASRITWMHRATKRASRMVETVQDPASLPVAQRRRLEMSTIILGTLRMFSSRSFSRKGIKAMEAGKALPAPREVMQESLKLFRG